MLQNKEPFSSSYIVEEKDVAYVFCFTVRINIFSSVSYIVRQARNAVVTGRSHRYTV
jgi:uncharacterized PurR-regulated membrane protein YhhQ (DUF165 family)